MRRPRAGRCLLSFGEGADLIRAEEAPNTPMLTAERLRTAFRGTLMAEAHQRSLTAFLVWVDLREFLTKEPV